MRCIGRTDSGETMKREAVAEIYRAPPDHGDRALMRLYTKICSGRISQ